METCKCVLLRKWFGLALLAALAMAVAGPSWAQTAAPDQITAAFTKNVDPQFTSINRATTGLNGTQQATLPGIPGIDSVPNFSGVYSTPGFTSSGAPNSTWLFNTLGNTPTNGKTTNLDAPIVPVALDFRNADGSPRFVRVVNGRAIVCGTPTEPGCKRLFFDPTPFIQPVLDSPVFSNSNYTSSAAPTQFADAVQRAEYQGAPDDWHTLLSPSVKTMRTMVIKQDATCGIGKGLGGSCSYLFALNPNGSCCFFVLLDVNVFQAELFPSTSTFPPDSSTPVGAAEAAGDITTKSVSTFFFPPAYLFIPQKHARPCCIGGFHSFDFETTPGKPPMLFVLNYSTWMQPIFLNPTTLDVVGLSHEISETYNDPFVAAAGLVRGLPTTDTTPWWLSPNGNCQNDLEDGDVIEGLPQQVFPIMMPNGFTYHPQVEALLQWFEFQSPSTALHAAYSYPDETTLTALSPGPLKPGCVAP
jgi:hypothetical protein